MRVVITEEAETDLEAIVDYLALDNMDLALRFADQLRAACNELGTMPEAYPLLPRYAGRGYRRRVHQPYLIIYRVDRAAVYVLRVIHGVRDYEQILDMGN